MKSVFVRFDIRSCQLADGVSGRPLFSHGATPTMRDEWGRAVA